MSIQIQDRTLLVYLIQNMGNGSFGNTIDISDYLEDIGNISFELDSQITKASLGSSTFKCFDDDSNSIWTFIQSSMGISDGLLPPFIVVMLDNIIKFYGIVDPKNITRTITGEDKVIQINSQEWFIMAGRKELDVDFWKRPLPNIGVTRTAVTTKTGKSPENLILASVYAGITAASGVLNKVYFAKPATWFQVGDLFTCASVSGTFKCIALRDWTDSAFGSGDYVEATLEGFTWPNPGNSPAYYLIGHRNEYLSYNFNRLLSETTAQTYYGVTVAVPASTDIIPQYAITLDTVNGLVPGDKLDLRADFTRNETTTLTINDIDSEKLQIVISEPLSVALLNTDKLYMNSESTNQLVYENFKEVIKKSMSDFAGVDFSRFQNATFTDPALSWLPTRITSSIGQELISPCDLQSNLTGLDIRGSGAFAWSGTPETSWSSITWAKKVSWTNQQLTAPSYLMPDDTDTLAPKQKPRNRGFLNWKIRTKTIDDDPNDSVENNITKNMVIYDYSGLRRWVYTRVNSTVTIVNATYNGSIWTTGPGQTWSGAFLQDAIPFPAIPSSLGSGASLLCLDASGVLRVVYGTSSPSLTLSGSLMYSRLVQTAYGAYVVNQSGYAKVVYSGGSLQPLEWIDLKRDNTLNLIPSTFCALDSNNLFCLAGTSYINASDAKVKNETWLFQLKATPSVTDQAGAIIQYEKIFDGVPRLSIAIKDPSANRIIGLLGGRLFQLSTNMSDTIERYSAEGLTALQLIENICMIQNCMAIPSADGTLKIISRSISEAPINITVDVISQGQSRLSDYFFSQTNISGSDDTIYATTVGSKGGKTFEMDNPFITTTSQARAISMIYQSFFGVMRQLESQEWAYSGGGVAPWEALKPMAKITINGGSTQWYVLSVSYSIKEYQATVKLLAV